MDLASWLNLVNGRYITGLFIFARFSAMLFAAPLISGKDVPNPVRVGLGVLLTLILVPLVPVAPATSLPAFVLAIGKEAALGLVLGWTASQVFAGVQMAGEWLDLHAGFQAGHILNPAFDTQSAPLGNFKHVLAGLAFLAAGGHGMMVRAAASTLAISPPGVLALHLGTADDWTSLLTRLFLIAIQLAAPVAAALFLAEIAIGLVNRALPQVNVMMLMLPVKAILAVGALALCAPLLARTMETVFRGLDVELLRVLRVMGA